MTIPPVGASITCNSNCVQCCPSTLRIFCCCCCHVEASPTEEKAQLEKRKVEKQEKTEASSVSDTDDEGYIWQMKSPINHRTDKVAVEALKEPEIRRTVVNCAIL